MARIITIEVQGSGGHYEAMVKRIQDQHRRLYGDASTGVQQVAAATRIWETSLAGVGSQLTRLIGIGVLIGLAKQTIDLVGRFQDLSDQTGISARTLAGLHISAQQAGLSVDEVAQGVLRLQKSLVESMRGVNDQSRAFDRLFTAQEKQKLASADQEKFLELVARRLAEIPNQAERTALAIDLASRSGARLNPIFREIAEKGMAGIRAQAGPLSNDVIKAMDEMGDRASKFFEQLKFGLAAAIVQFGQLLGLIQATKNEQLIDELNNITRQSRGIAEQLQTALAMREKGVRTGIAQDSIFNELMKKRNELLERSSEITKQMNEEGQKPQPPPLGADPELLNKQRAALVALQKELLQAKLAAAEFARGQGNLTVDVRAAAVALIEHEKATAISAASHNRTLTPALKAAIEQLAQSKIAALDAGEAAKKHASDLEVEKRNAQAMAEAEKELGEAYQGSARDLEILKQRKLDNLDIDRQILDEQAERLQIIGQTSAAERQRLQNQIQYLQKLKEIEQGEGKDVRLRDEQIKTAQSRIEQLGVASINVGHEISRSVGDIFSAAINGTLKLADVGQSAFLAIGRSLGDFFTQILNKKLGFENLILDNARGLPGQMNQAFTAGAASLPGSGGFLPSTGGGGGLLDSLGGLNIGGFNLGSIGMMLGQGALGFGLGSLVGGGRTGSGIGGALGALSIPGLLNMAAPALFGTATIGGAFGATAGALVSNLILPGIGAIVGGLLGSLFGGLFTSRPKKSTLGIGTTFEGIQSSPFGFGVGDIESVVTAVRRTKGAEVGFPGQVESIGLAVAGGVVDVLNIFPELVRKQLDAEIARANQAASAALNFTITGRGKKFQRNLNNFMAALPGVVLDAFSAPILKAFELALAPFDVKPTDAAFFAGDKIEDRLNALQSVAEITARAGDLSKFFFGAERGFVGQGLERIFNARSAAETQAAAQRFGQTSQGVFEAAAGRQQFTRNLAVEMAGSLADAINGLDPRSAFDQFLGKFETSLEGMIIGALQQAFIASSIQPLLEGPAFLGIMERFEQVGRGDLSAQLAFEQSQGDLASLRMLIEELRPGFLAIAELGRNLTGAGNNTVHIQIDHADFTSRESANEELRRLGITLSGRLSPS